MRPSAHPAFLPILGPFPRTGRTQALGAKVFVGELHMSTRRSPRKSNLTDHRGTLKGISKFPEGVNGLEEES